MFESIKDALNKKSTSGFSEVLRTEIGNTYEVKILANVNEPAKTFHHYYMHGWTSFATGEYVSILSPTTFNERDPISEDRFKTLKMGTEDEKEKVKTVRRAEKWLVNILVIKDPVNPENNGKVKMLRYGKQLQKVILDAIEGEDAEEFGEKVFDFAQGNAVFKIKVDTNGDFANYTSSRFTTGTQFELGEQEQQRVFSELHDLEAVYEPKSYDEVKAFYNTHFYVKEEAKSNDQPATTEPTFSEEDNEKLVAELAGGGALEATNGCDTDYEGTETVPDEEAGLTGDAEIDELLAEID